MKKPIKIKFQNGLVFEFAVNELLFELKDDYEFIKSDNPDFIVFGPYGNDIPPLGNYQRIGYFCENIKPDLSICDWAFGIPREEDINNARYKRIQWHGLNPASLLKPDHLDAEAILASKTKFCNFLYSHRVPYREAFFKQLSKYKKIDAPGKSVNNMQSLEELYSGDKWEIKKRFLAPYKFTIAFENDIFPGYQTEKLYDAMLAQSIPVYSGDPFIGEIFNTRSFINVRDYIKPKNQIISGLLSRHGQMNFEDMRPSFYKSPKNRAARKVKSNFRSLKTKLQFHKMDFGPVIEQIIALDNDPELYIKYILEPWFNNNTVPQNTSLRDRWIKIFNA